MGAGCSRPLPYELGLDRLVNLDADTNFIGRAALQKIRDKGVSRQQVGLEISGEPLSHPNTTFWPVLNHIDRVGKVTSAIYSPRLKRNIALAMVSTEFAQPGTQLTIQRPSGLVSAKVVEKPFYDSKKETASASLSETSTAKKAS